MRRSIWDRSFFPVLLTFFIDNFGLAIVYPIFTPLFLKPEIHLLGGGFTFFHRTFLLGLLIASFPIAQFFGAPFLGEMSDRLGRKKVFLATISGGVIGYLLTGLGVHFRQIHLLWTGRVLAGFFAGNLTLCLASIADITHTKKMRAKNFGWIGTIGGLAFVLAILTGGSLSNPNLDSFFRPDLPFFITSALSLVNIGLFALFFKESHTHQTHHKLDFFKGLKNIQRSIQAKKARVIYLAYFLFIISWYTSMQFLSAYLLDTYRVSVNTITLTFIFIGVSWSLANFIVNPILSDIVPSKRTFLFGLVTLSLFLYLAMIPKLPLYFFLLHFFIVTISAALCWTNGLASVSTAATKLSQGSILGVTQSVIAIASIVGPILGGLIAGIDIHKLYLFTATLALFGALLLSFQDFAIKKR